MNKEIELLCQHLEMVLKNPKVSKLPKLKNPDIIKLNGHIEKLILILQENYKITEAISEGKLDTVINKENVYAGPLMELQSILKHLTWQLSLVADGKLDTQIHFLGDFSKTFNKMIAQLKERESTLIENAILTEALNNQQIQILEQEFENQAEKYLQLVDSLEELRRFRHDMKNHFMCIDSFLLDENVQGAREYIHAITNIVANSFTLETNDNYIFNALIDEKLKVASQLDVKIHKTIAIHRKLNIKDVDICILLGNALDNCIDALRKVDRENRELYITIILTGDILSVEIVNTLAKQVSIKDGLINTTKREKNKHGIGLKNMKTTVEKYEGEMHIHCNEETFTLLFILCNI